MREDTLKSHQKLLDRGHVAAVSDLSDEEKWRMDQVQGQGYVIPWRTVYKADSLSMPCRLVFNVSSKTPGGSSLNCILAKGQNRLTKLQDLIIRFRRSKAAMSGDISMAYKGSKLVAEQVPAVYVET